MLTLRIPIEYYGLGSNNRPDYYAGRRVENAILTLTTIPAITYNLKAGDTHLGIWMSPSIYLGKKLSGKYYVTRIRHWDADDYTPYDRRVVNPIGWFYDDDPSEPFLTLYKFAPNEMPTVSGFGMLGINRRDGVSSGVEWSRL